MGQPKRQRKKYEKPKRPYDKTRIEEEKKIMKDFGLRRKKEIWRADSILRDFRRRARKLQASANKKEEEQLLNKLYKLGLIKKDAKLDDVLDLKLEDVLKRRLQTIVKEKGYANTMKQARQLIVHGHVLVEGKRNKWPSFLVPIDLEGKISLEPKMKKVMLEQVKE